MRGDERPELRALEEVRQTLAVAAVSRDGHAVSLRVRVDLGDLGDLGDQRLPTVLANRASRGRRLPVTGPVDWIS